MQAYTIRPAIPEDAPGINRHLRRIADEPENMISYSRGEFTRTVDEERARIVHALAVGNSHMLVAVVNDEIVGLCCCFGGERAGRHTTGLGITIHPDWRDQGIGTALMEAMIRWARENPVIRRLSFTVFTHNARALHVYRKLGFQEEGVCKDAYIKEGQFRDALMMAMLFDHEHKVWSK